MRALAIKYSDLPKVNGVHALTDMLQSTGVVFIISALFGSVTTGLYGLTLRILQAPLTLIGSSFSIVFYKEVSEKVAKNEKIDKLLRTTISTLALISFPIFLTIMIVGPSLFAFVFGEEWREAGVYARIMSPWLFVNFISSPVSHLPVILNRQRQFFLLSLAGNILVVLSLLAGSLIFKDVKIGFALISATQVIFLSGMIFYFLRIAAKSTSGHKGKGI
jgi:O-antigen/teichoic acid export membrane protein